MVCLSHRHHVVLNVDEVERLASTVDEVLDARGLVTPFPSSFLVSPSMSTLPGLVSSSAFLCSGVSSSTPDTEHTWHEVAPFASPAVLGVRLQLGSRPHFVSPEAHFTPTAASPFYYRQQPSSRTPHGQLLTFRPHTSNILSFIRTNFLSAMDLLRHPPISSIPDFFRETNELWHDILVYCSPTSGSRSARSAVDMVALRLLVRSFIQNF
jgi:hypothetical protein